MWTKSLVLTRLHKKTVVDHSGLVLRWRHFSSALSYKEREVYLWGLQTSWTNNNSHKPWSYWLLLGATDTPVTHISTCSGHPVCLLCLPFYNRYLLSWTESRKKLNVFSFSVSSVILFLLSHVHFLTLSSFSCLRNDFRWLVLSLGFLTGLHSFWAFYWDDTDCPSGSSLWPRWVIPL